jgi:hypothetical protein
VTGTASPCAREVRWFLAGHTVGAVDSRSAAGRHARKGLSRSKPVNESDDRRVEPRESVMEQVQLYWIASFVWSAAADVLRDPYARDEYRDVILPMRQEARVA